MKKFVIATGLWCGSVLFSVAMAGDDGLVIAHAWAPEAPPVASVMAGYVVFKNETGQPIKLVSARSAQFETVEFHRSIEKDGMARMVQQPELTIPAGEQLALSPGGYHLMLIGPKQAYPAGATLSVNFTSESGHNWKVNFQVKKPGETDKQQHHHHNHH